MTNLANLANVLAAVDGGAALATNDVTTSHNSLLASASSFATIVADAENKLEVTAKAWGCAYFNLTRVHNHSGDDLAEQSRVAMGWKHLAGEAGSKVKTRFNTLRSRCGVVSGRWAELSDETQLALLGGVASVNTVWTALNKADQDAKKAAKLKAEADKAADATAPTAPAPSAPVEETAPASIKDMIETLHLVIADAGMIDDATADAFEAMVSAYNAKVSALIDAGQLAEAA